MGLVHFGVPSALALWIRDAFGVRAFVETGTFRAGTAVWAREHFSKVVTIEGMEDLHRKAVAAHGHRGIEFLHGDSRTLLGPALEKVNEPALVWLDAHWCGDGSFGPSAECPVLEEIAAVSRSPHDHFVLIDDARLFLAPPPAPHKHGDWPDMLQLSRALSEGARRYAILYDDVIVAVPEKAREGLVELSRREGAARAREQATLKRRIARRVLRHFDAL